MTEIDPIYQEIAEKMKMGGSKALPKLLQKMVDLDQAKILRELPASSEEISKALALDKASVDKQMQVFFERGLVTPGKKGWNLHSHRVLLKDHIGSANPKYDNDEVFDLAKQMSLEGTVDLEERIKRGKAAPVVEVMRVIPKWQSIQDIEGVLPCEDMREILKNATPIMLYGCACRRVYRDRPCKETQTPRVCFGIGRMGDYAKARKLGGEELTYEEALAFFDKLDEQPFVTTTGNTNQMPLVLCNCHDDCCGLFINRSYTKPLLNKSPLAKSRFVVKDNPEECIACGACLDERCPVRATGMKFYEEFGDERSFTDYEECIGCGLCVVSCPTDARKMRLIRTPEHIPAAKDIFDV
jgi:ferredoxin